jgi:hypothetical protein
VLLAQSDQQANARAKPQLALRIGVTGARNLATSHLSHIHAKVRAALTCFRDEMNSIARERAVARFYASDDKNACAPLLRIISPLALGADRLVAEEALALGYKLYVPMPFSRAEYEEDFAGTDPAKTPHALPLTAAEDLDQFRMLLARAGEDWMSLDGDYDKKKSDRDDQRNRAYEAVGRFVVRNSDIVIAIWNGELAGGRGGTQEVVEYAAKVGVPVWWIHATEDAEAHWIADTHDARNPSDSPKAAHKIQTYLQRQILEPKPVPRGHQTGVMSIAHRWQSETVEPAQDYFNEQSKRPWCWSRIYNEMMLFASGRQPLWTEPTEPKSDAGVYWFGLYKPADARASEYTARYRSSYVWIFTLTALSVLFGALANLFHTRNIKILGHLIPSWASVTTFAGVELSFLALTAFIAVLALGRDWHERSIEYRLLAELCRKQQVLAPLGRAISFGAVRRLASQVQENEEIASRENAPGSASHARAPDRAAWVSSLFMAYQRAAPLPRGNIAAHLKGVLTEDVLQDLVDEQLQYHAGRAQTSGAAAEYFEKLGGWIFVAVLAFVFVKILLTWIFKSSESWQGELSTALLGLLGVVLPAWSAAAVGMGSYAEWRALAEESNHMVSLLNVARRRIKRIDLKCPLASQDLGAEADAVAETMLQDLEGWQRLFRVKAIETQ